MTLQVARQGPATVPVPLGRSRSQVDLTRRSPVRAGGRTLTRCRSEGRIAAGSLVSVGKGLVSNQNSQDQLPTFAQSGLQVGALVARGYWGIGPPKAGAYTKQLDMRNFRPSGVLTVDNNPGTDFRRHFERGDIPITMKHGCQLSVEWKVEPEKLDYMHYLPICFDGMLERVDPFKCAAMKCTHDMLDRGRGHVLPVVPRLIIPLKRCLNTKDPEIVAKTLNVLKKLITCDEGVGEALVPYYRQLLPVFNLFKAKNCNLGDGIDYAQRFKTNLGDLIEETLALLEANGGEDAFVNIKYMIPTYESVIY